MLKKKDLSSLLNGKVSRRKTEIREAWLKVCGSHRAPSIACTRFWFRLRDCPLHFYYPFWTRKMLLLLFKKKKSWTTLAFGGVSHLLEPSVSWLRGSNQIPSAPSSTPLCGVEESLRWLPEWSLCHSWLAIRDLHHEQNSSLTCSCWDTKVEDNTTHSWRSYMLVAYKD